MAEPITCPKCGKLNSRPTGAPDEACPHCGVIYAKAKPSAPRPQQPPPMVQKAAPTRMPFSGGESDFLTLLRAESAYPTFRAVVGISTLFGYILAGLSAIGGIVVGWKGAGIVAAIVAVAIGVVLYIVTRVFKEMWLMLADLTDATIRMARDRET